MTVEFKGQLYVYFKNQPLNIEIRRYGVDDYEFVDLDDDESTYRGTFIDLCCYLKDIIGG